MQKFAFALFQFASFILAILPLKIQYGIAYIFYLKLYYLFRYRRKVVKRNLTNAFPEKSAQEIRMIEKKFYRYFARLFLEINALTRMNAEDLRQRIRIKNPEFIHRMHKANRSIVAVMGHYCNWEWFSILPQLIDYKVLAIYKPLLNKSFDTFFRNLREKFGTETVPMAGVYRKLTEYKKKQIPVMTLFIADQSPKRSDINFWAEFLNQPTPMFLGPEKIARKLNQSVVFIKVEPSAPGFYDLEFVLLTDTPESLPEKEITRLHLAELEKMIRNKPEFWLWTHKRWKHKPSQN